MINELELRDLAHIHVIRTQLVDIERTVSKYYDDLRATIGATADLEKLNSYFDALEEKDNAIKELADYDEKMSILKTKARDFMKSVPPLSSIVVSLNRDFGEIPVRINLNDDEVEVQGFS